MEILNLLKDKVILITGGTGSMGKTFVRRALSGKEGLPKKIIVLSRDEAKQHYMRMDYMNRKSATEDILYKNFQSVLQFRIGDMRNYADVLGALNGVDIVINAAALKQVPSCEYFPSQAIMTNCLAVQNLVSAITDHKLPVQTVVGISTDKACKPINVMGMTKALQERIFISANVYNQATRFVCVRYGNVLASRGSVIPFFHEQIRSGGPVTVTHPQMTRFLLSLEDAVDTVLAAINHAQPGETVIPIAPSALVTNVAMALIGERKIDLNITGIRPGEKIHESLVSEEEALRTYRKDNYYYVQPMLPELLNNGKARAADLISEYSSSGLVMDLQETKSLLQKNNLLDVSEHDAENAEMIG